MRKTAKTIRAWAGFWGGKILGTYGDYYSEEEMAVYRTKKIALAFYTDVRPVEIRILPVKPSKRKAARR